MNLRVHAKLRLNPTGLRVERGQRLSVAAEGAWTDWTIPSDADGFTRPWLKPTERFRRIPGAPWFRLCGAIGEDEKHLLPLGRAAEAIMPASGILYLFANDIAAMYWNNHGCLEVEIKVLDQGPGNMAEQSGFYDPPTRHDHA